jgi:hypothetical protein
MPPVAEIGLRGRRSDFTTAAANIRSKKKDEDFLRLAGTMSLAFR